MKIKTADLIGPALDWAVAQCEGFKKIYAMAAWSNKHGAHGGPQVMVSNEEDSSFDYRPSSNWSQGGPIIEREISKLSRNLNGTFTAQVRHEMDHPLVAHKVLAGWTNRHGPTPLIAAMRCVVAASNLGDEVDIPDELV